MPPLARTAPAARVRRRLSGGGAAERDGPRARHRGGPDRAAVARRDRQAAGLGLQRPGAGADDSDSSRRHLAGAVHESPARAHDDSLARGARAERDGRRAAPDPTARRAGRHLHLRNHAEGRRHVLVSPPRALERAGRTRALRRADRRRRTAGALRRGRGLGARRLAARRAAPDLRPVQHHARSDARRALGERHHRQRADDGAAAGASGRPHPPAPRQQRQRPHLQARLRQPRRAHHRRRRSLPAGGHPVSRLRAGPRQPAGPGHPVWGSGQRHAAGGRSVLRTAAQSPWRPRRRRDRRVRSGVRSVFRAPGPRARARLARRAGPAGDEAVSAQRPARRRARHRMDHQRRRLRRPRPRGASGSDHARRDLPAPAVHQSLLPAAPHSPARHVFPAAGPQRRARGRAVLSRHGAGPWAGNAWTSAWFRSMPGAG